MIFTRISIQEAGEMLNMPYNPPSNIDEETFRLEYFSVNSKLSRVLESLAIPEEDYYLDSGFVISRGMGYETMSYAMLTEELIPALQKFLKSLDQDYQIRTNPVFLDGWNWIWNLYISKDTVKSDCPDKILALLTTSRDSIVDLRSN